MQMNITFVLFTNDNQIGSGGGGGGDGIISTLAN